MNPLIKKLAFKEHPSVYILQSPDSFQDTIKEWESLAPVHTSLNNPGEIDFLLAFVTQQAELDALIEQIEGRLAGDTTIWFCYPKGSSKKYKSSINRDQGWDRMIPLEVEKVSLVAIDQDWSALRFRKIAYIKSIKRAESRKLHPLS